jgi:hypothetical protein
MFGFGFHQDPRVANLAGVTFDPRWSDAEQALLGNIRLYDQDPNSSGALVGALMDQILDDKAKGLEVPPVGLSAGLFWKTTFDEPTGNRVVTAINHVECVDFVYDPGAGGYVQAALAAIRTRAPTIWQGATLSGGNYMDTEDITTPAEELEEGATIPSPSIPVTPQPTAREIRLQQDREQKIIDAMVQLASRVEDLTPEPEPEPDPITIQLNALTERVEQLTGHVADVHEPQVIRGLGEPPRLVPGRNGLEQVEAAVEALLSGTRPPDGIIPLSGLRELYTLLSGDYELTGNFHADRVYLANVTSATMASLCADALNKRVTNLFQEYPRWWEAIVIEEDFTSLHDVKWISLDGIGELPTVAEGAAYTEMEWDDAQETDSFIKKGGYLGLTIEAIDKDDTRRLRVAPRALAQAAWLTLSKAVSALFTANTGTGPALTDGNKVFDAANHNNLDDLPLSWAAWNTTRIAMRQQAEAGSGERLGALTAPRFLLVPSDLEVVAIQTLGSEGEPGIVDNDINPWGQGNVHDALLASARQRVIVIDLWTDANDWAAVANPNLFPGIGIAYRFGRAPEIFSVASPTAGLMFTNDTMPIKVRYFFAVGVTNYRALYKHNVAGG